MIDPDVHTILSIINDDNVWNQMSPVNAPDDIHRVVFTSLSDVEKNAFPRDWIPVGTLEFCTAAAKHHGVKYIPAINVPDGIPLPYTGRHYFIARDVSEAKEICKRYKKMIVKPADIVKRFSACEINANSCADILANLDGPFFLSEYFCSKIVAEWRVLFRRKKILSANPYYLGNWEAPNKRVAELILRIWQDQPLAGTLDFAVLETGQTYLIEAHPFIACGLYGYDGRFVLNMLRDAWEWLIQSTTNLS